MPSLSDIIVQYPTLSSLAGYLSTLDLFHLALTCRSYHSHILGSPKVFEVLRRSCLCDGRGLKKRQNAKAKTDLHSWYYEDEEIEVRLFAIKCDEAGALPCLKCGINICEECRFCPRTLPSMRESIDRRPHLNGPWQNENLMCLCDTCDAKLEDQLRGQFLNELCDCDTFKRWICNKCVTEESNWTHEYYRKHTVREVDDWDHYEEFYDKTKRMLDHQFEIHFYCMCGAFVPMEARPRCTWCKRRHRPEEEWGDEANEIWSNLPWYVDDGTYPRYNPEATGYTKLEYDGPIYQVPGDDKLGSAS